MIRLPGALPRARTPCASGELLGGADGAERLTPVLELNLNLALPAAFVADGWEGHRRQAHQRALPLRPSHQFVGEAQVAATRDRDGRRFLASLAA